MTEQRTALETQTSADESLGELLRDRALASSPRLLLGQALAGVALNAAVLEWHPHRWGIATATVAAIVLHALWSMSVQRTSEEVLPAESDDEDEAHNVELASHARWWHIRRASAIGASVSALIAFWFACMMLLGRLMS